LYPAKLELNGTFATVYPLTEANIFAISKPLGGFIF
jgi:hypothetical protein